MIRETLLQVFEDCLPAWHTGPMADGGDGTLAAILAADSGFQCYQTEVMGPLPTQNVKAHYLIHPFHQWAVIEAAQAHGMAQLPQGVLAPLAATSFGVGQLLRHILQQEPGLRRIFLAVGGSASTDAGMAALQALGAQFWDGTGARLEAPLGGGDLSRIARVGLPPWETPLTILTDVTNPLLGPHGTAAVYAPQKGADVVQVKALETGLIQLVQCLERQGLQSNPEKSGMGAAGGLAYGLSLLSQVTLASGFEWVAKTTGLFEKLLHSQVILTAEGRFDAQSLMGKGTGQLIAWSAAQPKPIPVLVLCAQQEAGLTLPPWVEVFEGCQITGFSVQEAMAKPQEILKQAALAASERIYAILQAAEGNEAC